MRRENVVCFDVARGSPSYKIISRQLRQSHATCGGRIVVPKSCTVVLPPGVEIRSAVKLYETVAVFNGHFAGQRCTDSPRGRVNPYQFFTLERGELVINPSDQYHLFEHLFLGWAHGLRKFHNPVEARQIIWRVGAEEVRRAIVINNDFRQPDFGHILDLVWHWLGQALDEGTYPDVRAAEERISSSLRAFDLPMMASLNNRI